MKITIYGLPGTGTSTVGCLLAAKLGYEFKDSGAMFRQKAEALSLTLNELESLAQTDPSYDLELDQTVTAYGQKHTNFVFDSRLAWHFIPDSFKIKFDCSEPVRIARIARRENKSLAQARAETNDRMEKIFERYARYYGITNCTCEANFDFSINTTSISPSEVCARLETVIKDLK